VNVSVSGITYTSPAGASPVSGSTTSPIIGSACCATLNPTPYRSASSMPADGTRLARIKFALSQ